jgi:hypothetical protein
MGLEIQLEGDDELNGNRHCKETVYIDEDVLAKGILVNGSTS